MRRPSFASPKGTSPGADRRIGQAAWKGPDTGSNPVGAATGSARRPPLPLHAVPPYSPSISAARSAMSRGIDLRSEVVSGAHRTSARRARLPSIHRIMIP